MVVNRDFSSHAGYSAAVFVAYAGVAYSYRFTLYLWWALTTAIAVFVGALGIAPRWARLRETLPGCRECVATSLGMGVARALLEVKGAKLRDGNRWAAMTSMQPAATQQVG